MWRHEFWSFEIHEWPKCPDKDLNILETKRPLLRWNKKHFSSFLKDFQSSKQHKFFGRWGPTLSDSSGNKNHNHLVHKRTLSYSDRMIQLYCEYLPLWCNWFVSNRFHPSISFFRFEIRHQMISLTHFQPIFLFIQPEVFICSQGV